MSPQTRADSGGEENPEGALVAQILCYALLVNKDGESAQYVCSLGVDT